MPPLIGTIQWYLLQLSEALKIWYNWSLPNTLVLSLLDWLWFAHILHVPFAKSIPGKFFGMMHLLQIYIITSTILSVCCWWLAGLIIFQNCILSRNFILVLWNMTSAKFYLLPFNVRDKYEVLRNNQRQPEQNNVFIASQLHSQSKRSLIVAIKYFR